MLFGGPGNDALLGGPNYPWIAFPADDTCDGGPGVDRFIGGTPEGAGCDAWISIP